MYFVIIVIDHITISKCYPDENAFKIHVQRNYAFVTDTNIQYNLFLGLFFEVYRQLLRQYFYVIIINELKNTMLFNSLWSSPALWVGILLNCL